MSDYARAPVNFMMYKELGTTKPSPFSVFHLKGAWRWVFPANDHVHGHASYDVSDNTRVDIPSHYSNIQFMEIDMSKVKNIPSFLTWGDSPENTLKLIDEDIWGYPSGCIALQVKKGYKVKLRIKCSDKDFEFFGASDPQHNRISSTGFADSDFSYFEVEMCADELLHVDIDMESSKMGFQLLLDDFEWTYEYKVDRSIFVTMLECYSPPVQTTEKKNRIATNTTVASTVQTNQDPGINRSFGLNDEDDYVIKIKQFLRNQGLFIHRTNTKRYTEETAQAVNDWINIVISNTITSHNLVAGSGRWTPELDRISKEIHLPPTPPASLGSLENYFTNPTAYVNPYEVLKGNPTNNPDSEIVGTDELAFTNIPINEDISSDALAIRNGVTFHAKVRPGYSVKFIISSMDCNFNNIFTTEQKAKLRRLPEETIFGTHQLKIELNAGDTITLIPSNGIRIKTITGFNQSETITAVFGATNHIFCIEQNHITTPTGKRVGHQLNSAGSWIQTTPESLWDDLIKTIDWREHIVQLAREGAASSFYALQIKGDISYEVKLEGSYEIRVTKLQSGNESPYRVSFEAMGGVGIEAGSTKVAVCEVVSYGAQVSGGVFAAMTESYTTSSVDAAIDLLEALVTRTIAKHTNVALNLLSDIAFGAWLTNQTTATTPVIFIESHAIKLGGKGDAAVGAALDLSFGKDPNSATPGISAGAALGLNMELSTSLELCYPNPMTPQYQNGYFKHGAAGKFQYSAGASASAGLGISPPTNQDFKVKKYDPSDKSKVFSFFGAKGSAGFEMTISNINAIPNNSAGVLFSDICEIVSNVSTPNSHIQSKYTTDTTPIFAVEFKFSLEFHMSLGPFKKVIMPKQLVISFSTELNIINTFLNTVKNIHSHGGLYAALVSLNQLNVTVKTFAEDVTGVKDFGIEGKVVGIGGMLGFSSYRTQLTEELFFSDSAVNAAIAIYEYIVNILSSNNKQHVLDDKSIYGLEISHHQKEINYNQISSGLGFIYFKATEGVNYVDELALQNGQGAESVSIPYGFYHFATPSMINGNLDAHDEADDFADFLISQGQNKSSNVLPPVLVLRKNKNGLSVADIQTWIQSFFTRLDTRLSSTNLNRNFVFYTTPRFIKQNFPNQNTHNLDVYHLWLGDEKPTTDYFDPTPHGFSTPIIWQFDQRGPVSGISEPVRKSKAETQFW